MVRSVDIEYREGSLTRYMPLPSGFDASRVDAADKILDMGNVVVCKPTRSGFTISAVLAAERRCLKTLMVAPTRNINKMTVRETVEKWRGVPCDIPGHNQCKYVKELIEHDELLQQLPIMMPDKCDGCDEYETCPITELERLGTSLLQQ